MNTYSREKIHDEFADLPVSRQRKWQLRRMKEGRCSICGQAAVTSGRCLTHAVYQRERMREVNGSVRRLNSKTYELQRQLGNFGEVQGVAAATPYQVR